MGTAAWPWLIPPSIGGPRTAGEHTGAVLLEPPRLTVLGGLNVAENISESRDLELCDAGGWIGTSIFLLDR